MLAQYALFDLVRAARLVWTSLLELTGLVPYEELEDGLLEAGTEAVHDTPRRSTRCSLALRAANSFTG